MQETHFQTLKEYINKSYEAGLSEDQIREKLVAAGWNNQDVLSVIQALKTSQVYAQPTNINSIPAEQLVQATTSTELKQISNPPKYKVTEAFKDGFNAMTSNITKVLLAGLLLLVTYVLFFIVFFFVIIAGLFGGGLYDGLNPGVSSLIFLIVALLVGAWYNAVFITGLSVPVKDAMVGQNTTFKELVSMMYLKSWRVALAQFGLYVIMLSPLFIGAILSAFLSFNGGAVLITILSFLISLVWVVLVMLRFVLAPYIALFEPNISLTKIYSKSYSLLKRGGQWFLFKFYLLIFVGYILFMIVTSSFSAQSTGYGSWGEYALSAFVGNIIGFLLAVLINSVFIALYVNRSNLLDPAKTIESSGGDNFSHPSPSASPLAGSPNVIDE